MKHFLIVTRFCYAALLAVTIGLSASGCRDSVSVSEATVEVPLSSLTVTPGTLQPTFSSHTTTYAIDVPTGAATVTMIATPKNSTTLVTIDGTITTQRSISLGPPGSIKIIPIVLESPNGLTSTYTVTITRLLSGDNNLSALSVKVNNATQPLVPGFDANTLNYNVDVQTNVTSVTVTATKSDPNAAALIGSTTVPAGANPGQAIIALGSPGTTTPVSIEVTAPNGSKKTYTLSIKRLSGDNNLSALSISVGTLNPVFIAGTTLYTVDVATNVTTIDVSATKSDPNAVMAIGSITIPAGTASGSALNLPLGGPGTPTTITISVTAQNGDPKIYTITVNRAASTDDTLSALSVTANTLEQLLNPSFTASTLDYTVNVETTVDLVAVSATKSDLNAVMLIGSVTVPAGTPSGQEAFPLGGPGTSTVVSILVTAQSGGAPKTYTVTVNRAASTDDTLSALSVTANTLEQLLNPSFTASTLDYTVNVETTVDLVAVSATKSDLNAVMLIGSVTVPAGTPSGQEAFPLGGPGTSTVVSILVTAQSGGAPKTYTVTVNRAL